VLLLAEHFLQKFSEEENKQFTEFAPETAGLFRRYDWPGNVRQLENVLRSAIVLNPGPVLTPAMLPEDMQGQPHDKHAGGISIIAGSTDSAIKPLWQTEKEAIMRALTATQDDVAKAAMLLEVSPSTLYRKLQAWRESAAA
jgi:two-component system repressor protein LuxO